MELFYALLYLTFSLRFTSLFVASVTGLPTESLALAQHGDNPWSSSLCRQYVAKVQVNNESALEL